MSIADKLTTVAENMPKVYEAGYAKGVSEGGGGSYYDKFWDAFQKNGEPTNYYYAFAYGRYTDENYNPKYDIRCQDGQTTADMMFYGSAYITDIKVAIYGNKNRANLIFSGARRLVTIPLLYLHETTTFDRTFNQCTALENLTIGGTIGQNGFNVQWSTKLSKASITSIINALSAETTGLTVTLSKEAVNNAFGIDVDDETTWGEGTEYYTLRHSKDNWTISYI